MNKILIVYIFAGLAAPALAQTTTPTTPNATTGLPIEAPSGVPSTSTTTAPGSSEAPSNTATSPIERWCFGGDGGQS